MRYRALMMSGALLIAAGGCDDDGPTEPGDSAAIEGRVESTTTAAAVVGTAAASAAQASTVAATQVSADGSMTVVAEATVDASGTFRIEDVPEGRTDLVVVARNGAEAEVGRVLVHGETTADVVTVVAPINGETTVEGAAFVDLRANGSAAASNSGGLAAFVHMSDSEAEAVVSSSASVGAVASAYTESQATLDAALGEFGLDLDAQARSELTTPLALQYAASRDGGADLEVAHEAFVEAVLDAYVAAGASGRQAALSTAAAASAAVDASAGAGAADQVTIVRPSVATNLRARQRLSADFSGSAGADATVQALAEARVNLASAGSLGDIEAELEAVAATVEAAVVADVLDLLSDFSLIVRSEVEGEVRAAFEEADLAARLAGATSAEARATALVDYHAGVEAAVQAVAAAMPAGVSFDTEAMVSLLLAACGSAAVS